MCEAPKDGKFPYASLSVHFLSMYSALRIFLFRLFLATTKDKPSLPYSYVKPKLVCQSKEFCGEMSLTDLFLNEYCLGTLSLSLFLQLSG